MGQSCQVMSWQGRAVWQQGWQCNDCPAVPTKGTGYRLPTFCPSSLSTFCAPLPGGCTQIKCRQKRSGIPKMLPLTSGVHLNKPRWTRSGKTVMGTRDLFWTFHREPQIKIKPEQEPGIRSPALGQHLVLGCVDSLGMFQFYVQCCFSTSRENNKHIILAA